MEYGHRNFTQLFLNSISHLKTTNLMSHLNYYYQWVIWLITINELSTFHKNILSHPYITHTTRLSKYHELNESSKPRELISNLHITKTYWVIYVSHTHRVFLNITNSISHLNLTNSMSHLNLTNAKSHLNITNAMSHHRLKDSMSHLNVTNATTDRNITNSLNHRWPSLPSWKRCHLFWKSSDNHELDESSTFHEHNQSC